MNKVKDFYDVLGVDRNATKETIKKAYKKKAKAFHPDVNKSPDAEKHFKEAHTAYEVLSNDESRESYNQYGDQWQDAINAKKAGYADFGQTGRNGQAKRQGQTDSYASNAGYDFDFSDLFSSFEGQASGFSGRRGASYFNMEDLFADEQMSRSESVDEEATMVLTLEDIMRGGKIHVQVQGKELSITIPASVKDGQRIRLKGMGSLRRDGSKGDLYIIIQIKPHLFYTWDGYDLTASLEIAPWHAALGTTAGIRSLAGETIQIKIPAKVSSGQKLRLAGKGLRKPDGSNGDLLVSIVVAVPEAATARMRELYRELADLNSFKPNLKEKTTK